MNSHQENSNNYINNTQNTINNCLVLTPSKMGNNNSYTNSYFTEDKFNRFSCKYPDNRLFSESKRNRLNDMKRNVCERMMDRIINHRRTRMDNILYYKPSIIKICQEEYLDTIGYLNDQDFSNYVNQFFSDENLSFYFDQISNYINNNEIDTENFEACVFQNDRLSFCPICGDLVFLTKTNLLCSLNCFNFPIACEKIINLDQLMTMLKNFLDEHKNCDKAYFGLTEFNDKLHFRCEICMYN